MSGLETCVLCPRLCRPACPIANGTSREAAVPSLIAAAVFASERGTQGAELAKEALALCINCGRCESFCHISHPLPDLLQEARERFGLISRPEPLRFIQGEEEWVAVLCDQRPWARALSEQAGVSVGIWETGDELGYRCIGTSFWLEQKTALLAMTEGRTLIVADGGVARAFRAAGIPFRWLHDVVPFVAVSPLSCEIEGSQDRSCCGGADPFCNSSAEDVERLGSQAMARVAGVGVNDGRCARHLVRCGGDVRDAVDRLIEWVEQ